MSEHRSHSSPSNVANKAFYDISPEELAELREAFRVFDQNGDGSITLSELRIVLDQMGLDPSEEELQDMIREVDEDQSGTISFAEFVDMVKKAVDTNKNSREELFRAFQVFDLDQNGFITMEELRTVLQATGDRPTDEDALEMIAEADIDGDGRINYDEFVLIMTNNTSPRK
ncbi:unnamed protein product [Rotaria sordida]|uniref:EF-hand domain-containing protein n=1 Tax=Rotaria sordida TaxID=392033 RepID=A0A813WNF5_9BILA|nr:unnamed protein product [Rotaria sordida]CAF0912431.1 unnamed protein product [Rotaria sordida]CAF3519693.1 unnamed protein product [Rotaria sordida]CAF3718120.1 unnamed protein product [Rotaria sordida]